MPGSAATSDYLFYVLASGFPGLALYPFMHGPDLTFIKVAKYSRTSVRITGL
jgi:hypothetical protein